MDSIQLIADLELATSTGTRASSHHKSSQVKGQGLKLLVPCWKEDRCSQLGPPLVYKQAQGSYSISRFQELSNKSLRTSQLPVGRGERSAPGLRLLSRRRRRGTFGRRPDEPRTVRVGLVFSWWVSLDGFEVRLCDPCALVRPRVPFVCPACVPAPPGHFTGRLFLEDSVAKRFWTKRETVANWCPVLRLSRNLNEPGPYR